MLGGFGEASEGLGVLGCGMVDQFGKVLLWPLVATWSLVLSKSCRLSCGEMAG